MATIPHMIPGLRADPISAPPLRLLAREVAGFAYTRTRATFAPPVALDIDGQGREVVVLPGFLASDRTTVRLRASLNKAGFAAHGWGLGRNRGVTENLFDALDRLEPWRRYRARICQAQSAPCYPCHHARQPLFGASARKQCLAGV